MVDKLYIVIQWHYEMVFSTYTVEYIYTDKKKAEEKVKECNDNNDTPMEEDAYGPLGGTRYDLWERQIDV